MKKLFLHYFLAALAYVGFLTLALAGIARAEGAASEGPDGQSLFLKNKCNLCHSIKDLKIEKTKAAVPAATEGEASGKKTAKEPPDLSEVGSKHDAAWIEPYLLKKTEQDGAKHKKKFNGTPEELTSLANWLASLGKK